MPHDYLADRAANYKLMENIRTWWHKRGYVVRTWLEKANDPTNGTAIWVIRTNIVQRVENATKYYSVE